MSWLQFCFDKSHNFLYLLVAKSMRLLGTAFSFSSSIFQRTSMVGAMIYTQYRLN